MRSRVLAIDLGSSSVRSALFAPDGRRLEETSVSRRYSIRYSSDGAAELEPAQLLRAARSCLQGTLRRAPQAQVEAVAASAFWHGLLGLDANARPLTPVFTWADTRSESDSALLRREFNERRLQARTGCMLRAPFWPAKLRWLQRTQPALIRRVARWTSPITWIFSELFGVNATSHSMASGTGLYHLAKRGWDEDLCAACGVRAIQLDPLLDAFVSAGWLRGTRIFSALGDGAASNLGSRAIGPGKVAINIGTSAAARMLLPNERSRNLHPPAGLFRHLANPGHEVLGGAVSNAGNLHRWCRRELHLRDETEAENALARAAAADDRLTVLPFWVAERAPTWPLDLRGAILGLTPATTAGDILRACTTSVFYRLAAILEMLEASQGRVEEIIVSGGILHSPAALLLLADSLGKDLRVCRELESSLRGAATQAWRELGAASAVLRPGRTIRFRPGLHGKHRARRDAQEKLERLLLRAR